MIYTDREYWPADEDACFVLDPHEDYALCGMVVFEDELELVSYHSDSVDEFMRDHKVCSTCANELATELNVRPQRRRKWVEEYADGELADYVKP